MNKYLNTLKEFALRFQWIRGLHITLKGHLLRLKRLNFEKQFRRHDRFKITHMPRLSGPVVFVSRPIEYTFPLAYAYLAGYLLRQGVDVKMVFKKGSPRQIAQERWSGVTGQLSKNS